MGGEPRTHSCSVRPFPQTQGVRGMIPGPNVINIDLLMVEVLTPSSCPTSCISPLPTLRCSGASRRFSHKYPHRVCTSHRGSIPNLPIANASCTRQSAIKGLVWTNVQACEDVEGSELDTPVTWEGSMQVGKWTKEELVMRKTNCRFWIGRWANLA